MKKLSTHITESFINEGKQKISLPEYKQQCKKALSDKKVFDDQDFYDSMIDAFTKGTEPNKFVIGYEKNLSESVNESDKIEKIDQLTPGLKVKVLRGGYAGKTGTIKKFKFTKKGKLKSDQVDIEMGDGKMQYIGLDDFDIIN